MLGQKCQANTRKLPTTLENNIYQRIAQLSQILANNSTLLTKAAPSQKQLKQILQHTYNCYDQLDFIYLDYSKHPIHYLDPKALAQNTQKIFRSTKCLLRHLLYSYDTFSLQIIQKANQAKLNVQQDNCTSSHCFICLKNINEMRLKEAKESILGPAQWRKIYQEELRLEQQELKKQEIFQKREDKQEYVSSVNFLAGIIKEMEDSAKNYEKIAQSVQRQNANEEHTVFVLQELIGKLKVKLGDKYKLKFQNKLKSMLKKMEEKNNSLIVAHQMTVTQQFNLKIEKGEHKARANGIFVQETILHKLKEENKRLIAQRNEFYDKLQHLKESEQKLETSGSFSRSVFKKKTLEAKYQKTEEEKNIGGEDRNTLSEKIENQQKSTFQQHILQNISPLSTKKGKKKIVGRMSAFHLKRIQTRNSQLSALVAKSIQEDNVEQESEQQHEGKEQQINIFDSKNSSLRNPQAEKTYKIQIGCQWEQSFCELANGKQVATVKSGSKKNKPAMNRAQKENEESMSTNKNRKSKLESLKNIIPTLDTKTLVADNVLPRYNSSDSHYLRDQRSALQLREDHLAQDHARLHPQHPQQQVDSINFEQRREDKKIKAVRVFKNVQDDLKNKNSHKKNRLAHEKALRTSKDNLGVLINTGKLQTNLQTKNNLTLDQIKVDYSRDEKMNYLKARVVTEQSLVSKKEKMIRNVVFKPEHLTIFGGVSESYNYQNWKTDFSIEKLTKEEQQTLQGLKDFIQNLKSFKNGLYENIVCFLNRPFSLIQKNEDGFRPLKSQWAEKLLVKIFLFHRKKCGSAICGHLRQFCGIIGYYFKE